MIVWKPIATAPKDNSRPLYLARLDDKGKLLEIDFDGGWEYWEESWELSHINGYDWVSAGGIESPTHWAYQDVPSESGFLWSRKASSKMLEAFKEAYKTGSIWTDRITRAVEAMLQAAPEHSRACEVVEEVVGCFNAAYVEGLAEALAETTDERLKDLVERRLLYANSAAAEFLATLGQPKPPQRGQACEVRDGDPDSPTYREWFPARFVALDLIGGDRLVEERTDQMKDDLLLELATTWELQAATGGDGSSKLEPAARETLRACADTLRMLVSTQPATPPSAEAAEPGHGLTSEQADLLLTSSLKPEEIGGAPDLQHRRVRELLHWFARLTQGNANPKWLRGHAFELAYYVATMGPDRSLDVDAIHKAGFLEGVNISPEDRRMLEQVGSIAAQPTPEPVAQAEDVRTLSKWLNEESTGPIDRQALARLLSAAGIHQGLPLVQEPKYTTDGRHLINRHSGELIPHEEPVFVFRARDALAVGALRGYLANIKAAGRTPDHMHADAVAQRVADFEHFASAHPERMKWPDTTVSAAPSPVALQGRDEAVTDEMVDAYLKANDAYWHRTDQQPAALGKWRNGTPREATRESLAAALQAARASLPAGMTPERVAELVAARDKILSASLPAGGVDR